MPTYQQGVEKKIFNRRQFVPNLKLSSRDMVYYTLSIIEKITTNLVQPVRGFFIEVTYQFRISLLLSTVKKKRWCS